MSAARPDAGTRAQQIKVPELSMTAQLTLFASTIPSTSPLGLSVLVPPCRSCGSVEGVIAPGKGPHRASVLCSDCGLHCGWLSGITVSFIERVIDVAGRPDCPIVIRGAGRGDTLA